METETRTHRFSNPTEDITGYRTNHDGTQTLAWTERADGSVFCIHNPDRACIPCVDADERLTIDGGQVFVRYWPAYMVRVGRVVQFDHSRKYH